MRFPQAAAGAALLAFASVCLAQTSTSTPNIGLQLPGFNVPNWQIPTNATWIKLDEIFGGTTPVPGFHVSGNLQIDGTFIAPNFMLTPAQVAAAIGYTPANTSLSNLSDPASVLTITLGGETKSYIDAADAANATAASNALATATNAQTTASTAQTTANSALTAAQAAGQGAGQATGSANVIQVSTGAGKFASDATATIDPSRHALQVFDSVAKLPRIDVTHSDFATTAGCANAADPTGSLDSTCAINAAIQYAVTYATTLESMTGFGGHAPAVYLPAGHYKINGSLYLPTGVSLIADGATATVLQQTHPTASLLVFEGGLHSETYANYSVIQGFSLIGSGKATTGNLLEINAPYLLARDVHFANTGGRGYQANGGERLYGENLAFYQVRTPFTLGGDNNESTYININGVDNGHTADPVSGSGFHLYCYDDNCVNGIFPTAGTAQSPTALVPGTHYAINIEKAVGVTFTGGDMKGATSVGGILDVAGTNITLDTLYTEAPVVAQAANFHSSLAMGGTVVKTTLTGHLTSATVNGTTYWTGTVADPSYEPLYFGVLADLLAEQPWGDYEPQVILPPDFNRNSTTASAYCPGLQQNSYEYVNSVAFYGANGVVLANRNGGTVTNSYDWGQCTQPALIEDNIWRGGTAPSMTLRNVHFDNVQGAVAQNGYTYTIAQTGANPIGQILLGPIPGAGVDFYTRPLAAGDPISNIRPLLTIGQSSIYTSNNPYAGEIVALRQSNVNVQGGQIDPDGNEFQPYALTPDTDGSEHIGISSLGTGGTNMVEYPDANGNPLEVTLTDPDLDEIWAPSLGVFERYICNFDRNVQLGAYTCGISTQNDWQVFDTPLSGHEKAQIRLHMAGAPGTADPSFSEDVDLTGSGAWKNVFAGSAERFATNVPLLPAAGITYPINPYVTTPTYAMPVGEQYIQYNPGTGVLTLPPVAAGAASVVYVPAATTSVTFKTLSGIIQSPAGALGASWTPSNPTGAWVFESDGANYSLLTPIGYSGTCAAPKAITYLNGVAVSCQ